MKTKNAVGTAETEVKKQKVNLQYKFSKDELLTLGHDLAEAQNSIRQLEDDRKQVVDEWKSRISTKEAEISSLSNRASRGYEYRDIECSVTLNMPPGRKTCVRLDTNETIWVHDLSDEEKQRTLDLKLEEGKTE